VVLGECGFGRPSGSRWWADLLGWFTGSVTELRPVPTDPAALKAWVASLSRDELMALTQQVASGALTGRLGPLGELGPRSREIDLAPPPDEPSLLTLTIELRGSKPRIWRRLSLPGDVTLDVVHTLFQAAMGWTDSHLHRFQPGIGQSYNQPYFVTEFDEEEGDEGIREDGVRLDQVLRAPGHRLTYLYDFGDGWEHRVTLESLAPLTPGNREPLCLGGARAAHPRTSAGSMDTTRSLLGYVRGPQPTTCPNRSRTPNTHGWVPVGYDPDAFDAAEATAAMRLWASGEHLPWQGVPEPLADMVQCLRGVGWLQANAWLTALGPRLAVGLDEEDVRSAARPWLAVLDAVGAGAKLTAAGYLPPVVVGQIAQAAGVTDWWIGKANREDLTWPVATLRENAQEVGLLRKAKGTLAPTARARAVADHPRELVATVLERLPLGKGFEADAGWLLLLGLAAGDSGAALDARVGQMLTDRGWRTHGSSGVSASDAHRGSRSTLDVLESMAGVHRAVDPALVTRLARATLLGVTNTL